MQIWNILDEKLEKFEFLGLQRSKAITFTSENIEQSQNKSLLNQTNLPQIIKMIGYSGSL